MTSTVVKPTQVVIQRGTSSWTGTGSDWDFATVTFPKAFKKAPLVTVYSYSTGGRTDHTLPMIDNVTPTGFRYGWYKMSGTTLQDWQAIGEV